MSWDIRWDIAPKSRVDIYAFPGVNFSGTPQEIRIFAAGGLQGDKLDGERFQSVVIVAPLGTRITFISTGVETGWEDRAWRAICMLKGKTYKTKEAPFAVRIPDLDFLDEYNARRSDPDFQASYPQVADLAAHGSDWSYGRSGELKNNVRAIKIDKLPS
jgi:hypothetical protein